jgi:uncharacterized protein
MLQTLLLRAANLAKDNHENSLKLFKREDHPLLQLMSNGKTVDLKAYLSLTENHIWALIEEWRNYPDKILSDYARRLWSRDLHCAEEIHGHDEGVKQEKKALQKLVNANYLELQKEELAQYYVLPDTSRRKSYKEGDSIYLGDQNKKDEKPSTLEFDHSSRIVYMLREQHKIEYVIYPHTDQSNQSSDLSTKADG